MQSLLPVVLYVACELIANVTASRPVLVFGMSAPGGVFIYALTFTLLDLIHETLGKEGTRRVVIAAFAANLLLALYTQLTLILPAPPFFDGAAAFDRVFGATPRIVAASLIAYLVSSLIDVEVFAWWKRRAGSRPWARVLASNAVSTAVDSAVFVAVAFAGTLPLLPLIGGQYLIKMAVAILSIPLMYTVRTVRSAR